MVKNNDMCRLYKQVMDTIVNTNAQYHDLIQPYNFRNIGKFISPTITTRPEGLKTAIYVTDEKNGNLSVRKLTPRECYRLMGVSDDDIDKLLSIEIGDSRHWKLAGNSIVVDCMVHIFDKLFLNRSEKNNDDISLW